VSNESGPSNATQKSRAGLAPETRISVASLGEQVRQFRHMRGLTLEALAGLANVSSGAISQLERGMGNPSFTTLVQLAHALDIPVTRLFAYEDNGSPVMRVSERRSLDAHAFGGDSLSRLQIVSPSTTGALEAIYVETDPGYTSEGTPYMHQGEEFGFVIEGSMEVVLDGTTYQLNAGDTIAYASTLPHWYRNTGTVTARSLWVVTPPSF